MSRWAVAWEDWLRWARRCSHSKLGVIDRYDTPLRWRRYQNTGFTAAQKVSNIGVAERARLLGYTTRPQQAVAGRYFLHDLVLDVRPAAPIFALCATRG